MIDVGVLSEYRKRGIGKGLLEAVFQYMREKGIGVLSLEVREDNTPALRLYEKLGFCQVGRRPRYYQKPREDALILRKEWSV